MLKAIRQFFERNIATASDSDEQRHALHVATAALFIEMIRADFEVDDSERTSVETALRRTLDLSENETRRLVALAELEADRSVELFQFTRLVDRAFTPQQKGEIVESLWRIALADDGLHRHEELLVRKVAHLLHVPHRDFIAAKRRARQSPA